MLLPALLLACAPASTWPVLTLEDLPAARSPDPAALRLVMIGDSGYLDPTGDDTHISPTQRTSMIRAIRQEEADAVVGLGDLLYPQMRTCDPNDPGDRYLRQLDARLGAYLGAMDAPALVVMGNHDAMRLAHARKLQVRSPRREACLQAYAAGASEWGEALVFPDRSYHVDLGGVMVSVLDTNKVPDAEESAALKAEMDAARGRGAWALVAGHHVWKAHDDKIEEDRLRPWAEANGIRPDLYVNGHAHVMQLGIYDGVPALTSGGGSKLRSTDECSSVETAGCEPEQRFGHQGFGYAVVTAGTETLRVQFRDWTGADLPGGCWERNREDPEMTACAPEVTAAR